MSAKNFYLTTTLPYVNSDPHVGFAMEIIRADIIARYKKLQGFEVFFNTGTDEHGQKIFDAAQKAGKSPQEYVDGFAARFKELIPALHLSPEIHFIRTTDEHHVRAAQEFWKRCVAAGDIYKKQYKIKYCVGCELEKTDSELNDQGRCILHPNLVIEIREEENYFFRFSNYQQKLLDFYNKCPDFVIPDFRFNEIKAFVERGLEDFSISRLKSKMAWGVPVPGDEDHVMYVWFDALVNYISTLGWPENETEYKKFWEQGTPTQYCGKDNLRQQSAMWQAMLMSAGLSNSRHIIIDGFITSGGQKMSKSLGNVISPFDVVEQFGAEALRYYVARELSPFEDSDMTMESFKTVYNAGLANGIGNLTNRILKLSETHFDSPIEIPAGDVPQAFNEAIEDFNIKAAADIAWEYISKLDQKIQETKPFSVIKEDKEKGKAIIKELVLELYTIARMLHTIMPETSDKIRAAIMANKMPEAPLFLRKD
ncbi:MAG: metG [Candidatus Paceibacter sp.]|jgi:methionyl-tRNA synthetase|nr:metG [Candidatus Paceibacter sp.]